MKRRGWVSLLGFAIGQLQPAPAPATANVFAADGVDPRRYFDRTDPWWRLLLPVAAVSSDFALRSRGAIGNVGPGVGTAFMVSPCFAMTSYHVLFGQTRTTLDPIASYPVTLRFTAGSDDGVTLSAKGRVRYWSGGEGSSNDVALILVDGCPGERLGWYDLATITAGDAVTMPSVSHDRDLRRLSIQHDCTVRAQVIARGWLLHDCASREGASGAPLIVLSDNVPLVVGMNAGEFTAQRKVRRHWDLVHSNWAVASAQLRQVSQLRAVIARDRARASRPNPLAALD